MPQVQPEPTISSQTVYSGHLIDLRKDTVQLPNGKTTEREIVVHPEVVAIIPLLEDGRIVFVRQYRKAADRILIELPAGGIEKGETAEQTVAREMEEETGYRVGSSRHLVSFFSSPGVTTEFMHLYEARGLVSGKPTEEMDTIEALTLSLEQAMERLRSGELADAKTVLGLLWYARKQGT